MERDFAALMKEGAKSDGRDATLFSFPPSMKRRRRLAVIVLFVALFTIKENERTSNVHRS